MPQKEIAKAAQCETGFMQINKCFSLIKEIKREDGYLMAVRAVSLAWGIGGESN